MRAIAVRPGKPNSIHLAELPKLSALHSLGPCRKTVLNILKDDLGLSVVAS